MPPHDELIYWLAFINASDLKLNLIKPIIQRWCGAESRPLSELFTLSPLEWSTTFGLYDEDVARAMAVPTKLDDQAKLLAQWQAEDIEPLTYLDSRYPQRFLQTLPSAHQPLMVWVQGAVELLNEPSVTVLNSSASAADDHGFLDNFLEALVTHNITLLNSYSRGFERTMFEQMVQIPTGRAIAILPMGLQAFHQTTDKLRRAKNSRRVALVSPFPPDSPFQENFISACNMLIDHLALVLLILQPDADLQTRGLMALNQGLSVFIQHTEETTSQILLTNGALPLTDLTELIEMIEQSMVDAALFMPPHDAPAPSMADSEEMDDSYSLPIEEVEPLDGEKALEILADQGPVPASLRERLQNKGNME